MQSEAARFPLSGLRDDTNSFAVDMVGTDAPDCRLLESLFWDKIQRGLGALTEDQNRLFARYHLDGAPVFEIAGSCDGSADGVRHRLARMHHRLQSALTEQGDTEAERRDCLPRRTAIYGFSRRTDAVDDVS